MAPALIRSKKKFKKKKKKKKEESLSKKNKIHFCARTSLSRSCNRVSALKVGKWGKPIRSQYIYIL